MPALYAEHFQWHRNGPPEPAPPPAVTDDKLDLSGGSAHDVPDVAERLGVKIEHRQIDEITDPRRLRKAPQIALVHRHRALCVHHAGSRYHGLDQHDEVAAGTGGRPLGRQ